MRLDRYHKCVRLACNAHVLICIPPAQISRCASKRSGGTALGRMTYFSPLLSCPCTRLLCCSNSVSSKCSTSGAAASCTYSHMIFSQCICLCVMGALQGLQAARSGVHPCAARGHVHNSPSLKCHRLIKDMKLQVHVPQLWLQQLSCSLLCALVG